jgi:chemotaxis protein MotB
MFKRLFIAISFASVLAGCVTSKTFEAKEAELAKTRNELLDTQKLAQSNLDLATSKGDELKACQSQARADQIQAQSDFAAATIAQTKNEAELGETRQKLEQCIKSTEVARKYTETLKAREENLRDKMKTEVASKEVEISRLRDQLSVRVLDRILFRSGRADILPAGKKVLDKLVAVFTTTDDMIRVEGHTDSVPIGQKLKEKYDSNWELSAARAATVVRYFELGHKIEPTRLEAVGFSKFRPVATGSSPEDLKRNRRVEIVLTAPRIPEPAEEALPSSPAALPPPQ